VYAHTHLLLGVDVSAALDEVDEDIIEVVVERDVVEGGLGLLKIPTHETTSQLIP
jgi:hypothetical protein